MKTYKFSEARQNLVVRPAKTKRSPLDVPGIGAGLSGQDIVTAVRAGRERVR